MKIALVSANIGGIDAIRHPVEQTVNVDIFYITEHDMPYPLPNLNNRLRGKYFKTQTHHVFPGYDIVIWVDGSVEITAPDFVEEIVNRMPGYDVLLPLHPDRDTVFQEFDFMRDNLPTSTYLQNRYLNEPFEEERSFYLKQHLPDTTPLYACRMFARWCTPTINAAFDEWWRRCLEFSNFDQTQFSFIAWKHSLRIPVVKYEDMVTRFFTVHKHA